MSHIILYPNVDGTIAAMRPTGELNLMDTAKKDVPVGVPFVIVEDWEIQNLEQETWECDFSEPDGYGGMLNG